MSMTDPIADMLTRIRIGQNAKKVSVSMPASKLKLSIDKVLVDEGYLTGVSADDEGDTKRTMTIILKYHEGEPVIERESSRTKGSAALTGGEWVASVK